MRNNHSDKPNGSPAHHLPPSPQAPAQREAPAASSEGNSGATSAAASRQRDIVDAAFEQVRAAAKRRGRAPDLRKPPPPMDHYLESIGVLETTNIGTPGPGNAPSNADATQAGFAAGSAVPAGAGGDKRREGASETQQGGTDGVANADPTSLPMVLRRNPRWASEARTMARIERARAMARKLSSTAKPTGPDGRELTRGYQIEPMSLVLSKEIRRQGWQSELAGGFVMSRWPAIVGPVVARNTTLEWYKNKKLFVRCSSTAWATELRNQQRSILQKIAADLGPDVVATLLIYGPQAPSWRHGPLHVKGRGPRDTYG